MEVISNNKTGTNTVELEVKVSAEDFEKAIGDYLSFEFSMVMQNREYLFKENDKDETD